MWENPINLITIIVLFFILGFLMFGFVLYFNLGLLAWGYGMSGNIVARMERIQIKLGEDFPEQFSRLENVAHDVRISRILGRPPRKPFPPRPTLRESRLFFELFNDIPRAEVSTKFHQFRMFRSINIVSSSAAVSSDAATGVSCLHPLRALRESEIVEPFSTFENMKNF